ncbi:MAG: AIR synthase-related protein, partial [Chloroflexota bacterium]|nr:AIR synthase-related protein [Chloroflexota bacterium]
HYTSLPDGVRVEAGPHDPLESLVFDPQTSGGLLFAVPGSAADELERAFARRGEPIWRIGDVTAGSGVIFTAEQIAP